MKRKTKMGILLWAAAVIICMIIIYVLPSVAGVFDRSYVAQYGSVDVTDDVDAYIVRDETVYTAPSGGTINQLAKEGQLVKGNSRIIEITGKGDSKKSGSSESILKALGKKAESAEEGVASASGYVSYYIDGSEGKLTTSGADKITEKYLDKYGDTSVKKFGTGSVAKGEPVFKIVTNGDWLVIFFVDKDQKNHYTEGSSVTMKFPDESNDVTGTVRSVTKDGNKYRVAIDSNMMFKSMLSKRKVSVSVTSASADGIVVKCSSIVKKKGQTGVIVKNKVGKLIFKPVMIKADNGEEAAVYQDLYMDSDGNFHNTMTVYDEVQKNPGKNEIKEASVLK